MKSETKPKSRKAAIRLFIVAIGLAGITAESLWNSTVSKAAGPLDPAAKMFARWHQASI